MGDPAHGREEGGSIAAARPSCQTPVDRAPTAANAIERPACRGRAGQPMGCRGPADEVPKPCGSADRTGHPPRSWLDRALVWESPAVRRQIHPIDPTRGDREARLVGTPLDRRSIRSEVVLAKWLAKPTCEHVSTQSRLGRREHAAPSISPENSHAISLRSPYPAREPRISDPPASAPRDLKPERSSALGIAREGRACDLVVTRLEASPLGRGTVVRAAAPPRALVNSRPAGGFPFGRPATDSFMSPCG